MDTKLVWMVVVVMLGLLLSCVAGNTLIALKSGFTTSETRWSREKGTNTLEGSALLRQRGGVVVTCAGTPVSLVPVSAYAEERIEYLYGSVLGGYRPAKGARLTFTPDEPEFYATMRQTSCDSQGRFRFKELPDGRYYVTTSVTWEVPVGYGAMSQEGGTLARRVELSEGNTQDVVLSQ